MINEKIIYYIIVKSLKKFNKNKNLLILLRGYKSFFKTHLKL